VAFVVLRAFRWLTLPYTHNGLNRHIHARRHRTRNEPSVEVPKRRKGIYILPNMITLAALFGGFYAIVMAMNGRFDLATLGIFAAMVLDSLDGRVARMTNTQSAFGEQMDSLSDMVSFGAAPALWPTSGRSMTLVAGAGSRRLFTAPVPRCAWRAST
jgi:phosphatidylglycerophosphate synthase